MPDRFPAEVAELLREAGWVEGRRTDAAVARAVEMVCARTGRNGAQLEPFAAATDMLSEFGGLFVVQDGPGTQLRRRPFAFDPTEVSASTETLADAGRRLSTRLFPIGMEGDHDSILAIDESGAVYAFDHAGVWRLGETVEAAITALATGAQPPRLDSRGEWQAPAHNAPMD